MGVGTAPVDDQPPYPQDPDDPNKPGQNNPGDN